MTHFLLNLSSQTGTLTFSCRICCHNSELIAPSMIASCPGSEAAKQLKPWYYHLLLMLDCSVCSSPNITLLIQAEKLNFGLIHPLNINNHLLTYPRGLEQTVDSSSVLFGEKWFFALQLCHAHYWCSMFSWTDRNGFVTLSSLVSINNSSSKVLKSILCLSHDTLPHTCVVKLRLW